MNLEKYTERARGFVQSAQSLAIREGHQQFTPEHILKVLLDDEEGLCGGLKGGVARLQRLRFGVEKMQFRKDQKVQTGRAGDQTPRLLGEGRKGGSGQMRFDLGGENVQLSPHERAPYIF